MQWKHVDHIRELFAPPAVITSEEATGPSTVESSRAVPLEDVGDAVPDTNHVEDSMPWSDGAARSTTSLGSARCALSAQGS